MKTTLPNNLKTRAALSNMIESGYYSGFIKMNAFEMSEKKIVNNFSVKGRLESDDRFVVKAGYCAPLNFLYKIGLASIIFISLYMYWHWISLLISITICAIFLTIYRMRCSKEMDRFFEVYVRCKI
ncbi:hypothetical protein BST97_11635 [Nonlabens spongiae]|uniref:Uncharacterized protein n=1 Tax=Nonlabens spongiae TaxID=331648 RepID=A0A1W6MLV9_9FLAO|nr:hypothetical protein [Nonlabens spongiae]ARN78585.1 hypothetical protein BST97_11635 [Nonlabens spongiae]